MKLSIKWSILGFFLPIIGVIIGHFLLKKNEMVARSIRRGSALSTIIFVLVGSFLIYYFAFFKK
ncbi:MAG: hypothetical protein J6Y28_07570 [Acholeplasmatales bacterium]|nr:hypothetical protein [Acholeplasmatales bacterium]